MKGFVTCRDCKYFNAWRTSEGAEKHGQIYECSKLVLSSPSPDDYCSKAEKKEQKSGNWIPVSERLPEDGTYLVTVKRITSHPNVDIDSFAKDLYKVDEFDFCDKKGKCGWYNYDNEYGYWEDDKVIAWMPLPKPYEPKESEE